MTRRVYLYFALTFLLGVVVGGAGMFLSGWYMMRHHRFDKQHVVRRLTRELNLTDTQVQQLSQIVEDTSKKYSDLQKQVDPQYRAIREESHNRIRQILTPDQLAKFNEMVRRQEERMKKQRSP